MAYRRNPRDFGEGRGYGSGYDRPMNNYGGSSVNPWASSSDMGSGGFRGMSMGGRGSDLGMRGLDLGSSSGMSYGGGGGGGGRLNISDTDTLALANNLINNLLRTSNPQPQQPPSLLDLNTMGMGNRHIDSYAPQGFDRMNVDRSLRRPLPYGGNKINNRGPTGPVVRRGGGPIKSNYQQRGNINRNNKPALAKTSTGTSAAVKKGPVASKPPVAKTADKDKKVVKRDDSETEPEGEKKREWKDEKKTDAKAETTAAKSNKPDEKTKQIAKGVNKKPPTAFADLAVELLYCHICKKSMWDAASFDNHLRGRAHQSMVEGTLESYRLKCDMIRQESKVAQKLHEIELDRQRRAGKVVKAIHRDYCTMCQLTFVGQLVMHRRSEGHQKLKRFLHPKCTDCNMEFPTRIEWDEHLLTAPHLKKVAERGTFSANKTKKTSDFTLRTEADEIDDVRDATAESEDASESAPAVVDPPETIVDYTEGMEITNLDKCLPKYNSKRALGQGFIHEITCYECKLCGRFFDTEKTSKLHSRSAVHYENFIQLLKSKAEEAKRKAVKRTGGDDEGNWKRQKVAKTDTEEGANDTGDGDVEGEEIDANGDKEDADEGEGELYDPTEALTENETDECKDNDQQEEDEDEVTIIEETDLDKNLDASDSDITMKAGDELWEEVDKNVGILLDDIKKDQESVEQEQVLVPIAETVELKAVKIVAEKAKDMKQVAAVAKDTKVVAVVDKDTKLVAAVAKDAKPVAAVAKDTKTVTAVAKDAKTVTKVAESPTVTPTNTSTPNKPTPTRGGGTRGRGGTAKRSRGATHRM